MTRTAVIYVLVNSLVLTFERTLSATLLFDLDGHSIECLFFALLSTNAQTTAAGYYRKYQSSEQRAAIVNSRMASGC